jgi:opacity protein-like surface antigen
MRQILLVLLCNLLFFQNAKGQATTIQGKPIAEIFTDFHINLDDSTKTTGFGLNRAYFGYNFLPPGDFSGTIIVNIGNPENPTLGLKQRRYAFIREASLTWTKNSLNINFGITGTRIFNYQQQFWGKRYIANTYQSINGYGNIADLGVVVDYKFNDIWKGDISVMNGEGYAELQLDNGVKTSVGLTVTPDKHLAIRIYGDINRSFSTYQCTLVGFAGYKNELITIGAEASFKSNLDRINGHNGWGISGTGGINITKKAEIFVRYDYSTSVTVPGDTIQWNHLKDGSFLITGIQYTFTSNVKVALDYQGTFPYTSSFKRTDAIFINALFKF